jgi:CTP:molybdopterin cytidylyltransferase MocA
MTDRKLDVIVLAGGRNSLEMEAATGARSRALIMLAGRTMLSYVIDALRDSPSIGRVFVVGDMPPDPRCQLVPAGETLLDNMLAGIRAAGAGGGSPIRAAGADSDRILVATSDTPFLQPEGIEFFIAQGLAADADLCYPIVPIDLCRRRFPEMKRTTLRTRDGTFTGGNMMLLDPRFILDHRETILSAYAARKSVLKIARLLGGSFLLRILIAQTCAPAVLSVAALEAGVSRVLGSGCRARAVVTPYPEIGTDVDKPSDVAAALKMLTVSGEDRL